ncbi:hypothetical protein C8Q80DRAFT_1147701 [Daedaleopsis nitida]|nr:hypothetical protein C8Q80DRAFT_1147701 [Daedaleopsis nitida]
MKRKRGARGPESEHTIAVRSGQTGLRAVKHLRSASQGSDSFSDDRSHPGSHPLSYSAPHSPALDSTPDLSELLNFCQLDTRDAVASRFSEIADQLLHHYCIEISTSTRKKQLEILEIEFYLYKSGCHEDPYTHASSEQSQAGRWYFHRAGSSHPGNHNAQVSSTAGYRGGSRKGLDLTIGQLAPPVTSKYFPMASSAQDTASGSADILRGGILLRSVRRISDAKIISGPSLLVDEILRLSGASTITELVSDRWNGNISAFAPSTSGTHALSTSPSPNYSTMYLVRSESSSTAIKHANSSDDTLRIFNSPRIGLDLSHSSIPNPSSSKSSTSLLSRPRITYIAAPYRYFIYPHLLTTKGRAHTFVGVHDSLVASGTFRTDAELVGEIVRLTGIQTGPASKYLAALRDVSTAPRTGEAQGKDVEGKAPVAVDDLKKWLGPKGKKVSSSATEWLTMVRTLRRLQG